MRIYPVPPEFQPQPTKSYYGYPLHNASVDTLVEESVHKYMISAPDIPGVEYLPVYWSAYHIQTGYGKKMADVAEFIKALPRDKKLFTTVQYDDGTLADSYCQGRNVVVFGAGGVGDVPIPLLCAPHPVQVTEPRIFASFIGSLKTHPLREELAHEFVGKPDSVYVNGTGRPDQLQYFRDMMKDTLFAICPRGYGRTSFRLYEAIQIGCIPVYVYDYPWAPFEDVVDWRSFGVLCPRKDIRGLYDRLKAIPPEQIARMRACLEITRPMFTIEKTCQYIYGRMQQWRWPW